MNNNEMKENYQIELFVEQHLECGEGPVWDDGKQCLYWTDSAGSEAYFAHEHDRKASVLFNNQHAASITLHKDGGIMACGRNGFYHIDINGNRKDFPTECDGIPVVNINDIIADASGRVIGGQEAFRENENYDPGYLFGIGTEGKIKILEGGLHLSNGMGFSADSKTFYLVDSIAGNIYAYDYDLQNGNISNKRILIKLDRNDGLPDGMTVDEDGFIWVARWFGNGISRYDPDGKLERKITLPVAQPSSVAFGGKDYNHLFITSAAAKWITPLAPLNHDYSSRRGGSVYRIAMDIKGKPEYRAGI